MPSVCLFYRVSDSLLVYIGNQAFFTDFIVLALQEGRIAVYFNDFAGILAFDTAVGITSQTYNDSRIHQLRLVFRGQEDINERLELVVDNSERVTVQGIPIE